jgi:hypothetical protein
MRVEIFTVMVVVFSVKAEELALQEERVTSGNENAPVFNAEEGKKPLKEVKVYQKVQALSQSNDLCSPEAKFSTIMRSTASRLNSTVSR